MPNISPVTFHTVAPERVPPEFAGGVFLDVIGIEQGGRQLWLPQAGGAECAGSMTVNLPSQIGANIANYFERYHIDNPTVFRNCHIGAVAMSSGEIMGWPRAEVEADRMVYTGEAVGLPTLESGVHGVYGNRTSSASAIHSIVGLTDALALQTYNALVPEQGMLAPLNIASHIHNLAHYKAVDPGRVRGLYARKP